MTRALACLFVLFALIPQPAIAAPTSSETQAVKKHKVAFVKGRLSVSAEALELEAIMTEISQKTGIGVFVSPKLKEKKVTVQFENVTLEAGLDRILQSAGGVGYALGYQQSKEPGKVGQWRVEEVYLEEESTEKGVPQNLKSLGEKPDGKIALANEKPKGKISLKKEPFFDKKRDRFVEVVEGEVIVRFKKGLTDEETRKVIQDMGATVLDKNKLGIYRLKIPKEISVEEFIERRGADEKLNLTEPNFIASTLAIQTSTPNDPSFASQWAITTLHADKAWQVTTGNRNVVVAILDTGVDLTHEDIKQKIIAGYDFANDDTDPSDDHGHGTHVAGIIGAETNNGVGVAGISWDSPLMPVKVITASGEGAYSDVMDGILYAADKGARVLNISIGGYSYSQVLGDAVEYAHTKGAVLVAAGEMKTAAIRSIRRPTQT